MSKLIPSVILIALASIQNPIHAAWTSKNKQKAAKENAEAPTAGLNVNDKRSFFIEADYLFWRPQLEDAAFTIKESKVSKTGSESVHMKLKQPNYNLSSGARLGLGGYNSDSWDIGLTGTYLYSQSDKKVHSHVTDNQTLIPQWIPSIFGLPALRATANWHMNFYTADFSIGREFFLTKRFAVHPTIGLRGFGIDQKLKNKFTGIYQEGSSTAPTAVTLRSQFNAYQNVWGIGPRMGLDVNFYLHNSWVLLGGLSGSLLYSNYRVKEKFHGYKDLSEGGTITISPFNGKVKDHAHLGRANMDAYFGLGWDKWFKNGKNRLGISLSFEASQWFQMNQWLNLEVSTFDNNPPNNLDKDDTIMAEKRRGDLSFVGGTLRFQIDF